MTDPAPPAPVPARAFPNPTAEVVPYLAALGPQFSVEFLPAFGGAILDMGNRPKRPGRLAALVGHQRAATLAAHAHQLQRRVPLAKVWQPCCTGTPSRITRDPQIEAFARARIHTETFPEIAPQIAATFPPRPPHRPVGPVPPGGPKTSSPSKARSPNPSKQHLYPAATSDCQAF